MRFNRKRIIAILVFLLLSFFMITFGNPLENEAIVTRNVKFIDGYDEKLLAEKTVELGKAVIAPTVPEHRNFVFIDWYNEKTDAVGDLNKILENTTFIAKYADDRNNNGVPDDVDDYYTVRFVDGLNSVVLKTQRVLVGLDATAPGVPTHEGYTFGVWDTNFENVRRNLTVTGTYDINSYSLKINYNYAKDSTKALDSYSATYNYNASYSVISGLIAGYTADKLVVNGIMPASDLTVEVLYSANKDTAYKVEHYKENLDGTYSLTQTDSMVGTTDTLTNAIAKSLTGFTVQAFSQENINGNGETIVKIYYTRNIYTLTYNVDGVLYDSFNMKYEASITPLVKPTKVGYTFSGWSTIPTVMPASNIEVNGTFKVNKYCLTIFYINEHGLPMAVPYMNSVNYGSSYSITSSLIAGYTADKLVVSGVMPANNKIIFVTYEANHNTPYKIEYYKNGILFETENKTGTTDSLVSVMPNNNKYLGYYYDMFNFKNWLVDTIHGDGDTVLKVYYKTYNYNLSYNSNKPSGIVGVSSTPSGRTYTVESSFNITATMSSTSHNFLGWYTNSAGTGSPVTMIAQGTTGNKTLYAKWDIKKYTVTFNEGTHGSLSYTTTLNVPYNSTFGSIAKPIVTPDAGYSFTGWSVSSGTRITGDRTVTALYSANTNTAYKVEHYLQNINDNGYTLDDTENLTGTTDTLTNAIAKSLTGFTVQAFSQENINGNGSTVVEIYYNRLSYTLTFDPDNGSATSVSTVKYGASITAPSVTKTGYTFSSWTPSVPATMPAANSTYTALWTINSHNLTINYKYSNGTIASTQYSNDYNYNAGYSITSPLINGYTADTLTVSGTIPDNNVIVDVTYSANINTSYKVEHYTENLDGGYTLVDIENLTGTTDTQTNAIAKSYTGFTVQGFSQANIDGDGSTVIEIHYTRNSYTLSYKVNGIEVQSSSIKYDETITPLANPTLTGYTFSGWSPIPSTMPAAGVEINGTFTINSYNLTVNYKYTNGTTASTQYSDSYNYNSSYDVLSQVIVGYTADILSVSGVMPADNVTVDVTYTANTNTVYQVKHYTENLGSGYTLVGTDNLTGTTDTQTNAIAKSLTGFTVQSFSQENINGDGSTVVEIRYNRNINTLTYKIDGSTYNSFEIKYGEIITPLANPTLTGYTFSGWSAIPSVMPDNDVDITGSFTINSYALTFVDTTGATILRYVDWGNALTDIPTITPVTGKTCVWDEDNFTNITSNDTINAVCSVINYTITYDLNNSGVIGANHTNSLTVYNVETPEYTLAIATSTSDNFDGWFTAAVGGTEVTKLAGGAIGNITLYAHWTKKAHTVDFEENGGTSVLPLTNVYYGSTIAEPAEPTKTGFTFEDWYKEEILANKWAFATDTVTSSLTLYANWSEAVYGIAYNINDGGVVNAVNPINKGTYTISDAFLFNDASSDSHNFLGWYTENVAGTKTPGINLGTTGDKAYYAQWSIKTYTITFVDSNENEIKKGVNWGATLTDVPTVTPKTGYTCNWDRTDFTNITGDLTVNAKCTLNNYTLTVNANSGTWSGTTPQTISYNSTATIADPSRTGYTFTGWSLTGTGSNIVGTTFTMGYENATLTANWTINNYTLTVNANGGTWSGTTPQTIEYNNTVTIADPSRTGYTFTGWVLTGTGSSIVGTTFTMGYENATLTANWSQRFTVAFNSGTHGTGIMSSITNIAAGSTETIPDCLFSPDSGYTFIGWKDQYNDTYSPTDVITVTRDLTLTAQWDLASITFVDIDSFWTNKIRQWGPTSAWFNASMVNNDPTIQYFYLKGISSLDFAPNNQIISVSEVVNGSEVPFSSIDPFTLVINKVYFITVKTSGNATQKIRVTVLPE